MEKAGEMCQRHVDGLSQRTLSRCTSGCLTISLDTSFDDKDSNEHHLRIRLQNPAVSTSASTQSSHPSFTVNPPPLHYRCETPSVAPLEMEVETESAARADMRRRVEVAGRKGQEVTARDPWIAAALDA